MLNWPQATFASKLTLASGLADVLCKDRWRRGSNSRQPARCCDDRPSPQRAALRRRCQISCGRRSRSSLFTRRWMSSPRLKTLKVAEPPRGWPGNKGGQCRRVGDPSQAGKERSDMGIIKLIAEHDNTSIKAATYNARWLRLRVSGGLMILVTGSAHSCLPIRQRRSPASSG